MLVQSPAKINWTLNVQGRRDDGFHEIESLVSAVNLCDELEFTTGEGRGFELLCEAPDLPLDERNLVMKAAGLLAAHAERVPATRCRLIKRIPIGGGLGGGSSNAAITLRALNRLWSVNLPDERLLSLASELGSDVPFFLHGGSAVIAGRGERVRPVRLNWEGWIVLLLPPQAVSTAAVYAAWRPQTGGAERAVVPAPGRAEDWMRQTFNMLEEPAFSVCPGLRDLRDRAQQLAGRHVRLSGSGAALFTVFDAEAEADEFALQAARDMQVRSCVVQPLMCWSDYHAELQRIGT